MLTESKKFRLQKISMNISWKSVDSLQVKEASESAENELLSVFIARVTRSRIWSTCKCFPVGVRIFWAFLDPTSSPFPIIPDRDTPEDGEIQNRVALLLSPDATHQCFANCRLHKHIIFTYICTGCSTPEQRSFAHAKMVPFAVNDLNEFLRRAFKL